MNPCCKARRKDQYLEANSVRSDEQGHEECWHVRRGHGQDKAQAGVERVLIREELQLESH